MMCINCVHTQKINYYIYLDCCHATKCPASVGRRAFSVAARLVWNSLADYICDPAI